MKLKLIVLLLTTVLAIEAKAQDSASIILENAYARAKVENKNVFVKYSASWCGWCKKLDKKMKSDSCKAFFDDNYVIVTLIVKESSPNRRLENPGAMDTLKKHNGRTSGLPFWVILDSNGNLIEDALNDKGKNIGCPSKKKEVEDFVTILKNTSNLTEENLVVIEEEFLSK